MDNRGLKLAPSLFADILIELFDGKIFERQDAIDKVKEYHLNAGGILEEDRDYIAVFKAAAQVLKNNGLTNKGYGVWQLNYEKQNVEIVKSKKVSEKYSVDETIGTGDCAVYVYYYDIYKKYAEINNKRSFECKIGRTDKAPIHRILEQTGTCYPEKPHIALIIHCENSKLLEAALHRVLCYKGKKIEESPGDEWFITSPEEIKGIYLFLQNIGE